MHAIGLRHTGHSDGASGVDGPGGSRRFSSADTGRPERRPGGIGHGRSRPRLGSGRFDGGGSCEHAGVDARAFGIRYDQRRRP